MDYRFHWSVVTDNLDLFAEGAWLTVQLALTATALGLLIGVFGALFRTSGVKPLVWLSATYVEVVRNTPFLVQLYFIYFGLPSAGVRLSANEAALLALTFNLGAYATEIVRAGVEAIHKGQIEAGLSLGLSRLQVFRYVVVFPALEKVYPALTSQFILLMLNSSVVSQISADELTFKANFLQSRTFRSFEIYFFVTIVYLALSMGFRMLFATVHYFVFSRR